MARYRKRRYYKKNKGRWSANIREVGDEVTISPGINATDIVLCVNPEQTDVGVSQVFTVKNIELNMFAENTTANSTTENIAHYIMYVPQGMNMTTDYNLQHPEYIMAYSIQGNSIGDSTSTMVNLKIKSRLARKLQTGDKIVYFFKCQSESTGDLDINFRGVVRWWSKAN